MKTKALIFFSLLIGTFLQAQNVKLDIKPHFLGVRADSLLLSMDIAVTVENMDSRSTIMLTPVLNGQGQEKTLPNILLNGKQKQKLYLRNQILRKKGNDKERDASYLVAGIDESHFRTISYQTSLPIESWMSNATLSLKRSIIRPEGEELLKDTFLIALQEEMSTPFNMTAQEIASPQALIPASVIIDKHSPESATTKMKYRGSYISPETDDVDTRNRKELNFSLEEAKMIADINPQMLSLRELYTVALSYTEDRAKFYQMIQVSVKLYPVHPTANLNAAAAAIEMGNSNAAGKFLSMAPRDSLAYKNCRGVYELMTGNTYEGIRMLKAAKAEGSEEASYNLNVFFNTNKRP